MFHLLDMVGRFKATDAGRLRAEYNRLVNGLAQRGDLPGMWDIHALSSFHYRKGKKGSFCLTFPLDLTSYRFVLLYSCRWLACESHCSR